MKKFYFILFIQLFFVAIKVSGQNCALLNATFQTYESRCAATGAIKVNAVGGSGSYKYKVTGPVNSNFTTSDSLTGLASGVYTVTITDIVNNCTFTKTGVVVQGNYEDPRFILNTISVGCDNGSNGIIKVENLTKGRAPYTFSIVAPSASGIGTSRSTGIFTGLVAGDYSIRLSDSCGGIQTRTVTVNNYSWHIDSYSFTKYSCDFASGYLKVVDSRGNVSTITGIPGLTYAVVTSAGDTSWSPDGNFHFDVNGISSIEAFAMDSCGTVKKVTSSLFLIPSVAANVSITAKTCSTFTASVTRITNFFDPDFYLYDEKNNLLESNETGKFTGLAYGSYCIKSKDNCTDTTITRCFTVKPPVASVAAQVTISDKNCDNFDVAVTGQSNLTNAQYCLLEEGTILVDCNATGSFGNVPYGNYCIVINDGCMDTTITRCFSVGQPQPRVDPVIIPSYVNCVNFGLAITGDSLHNPTFCLVDISGLQIDCNSTGIFDSIPLGSYCVTIYDECTDSTIERCFTVGKPTVVNDLQVDIDNQTCSTFTATLQTTELQGQAYYLYGDFGVLIRQDSSGIFPNLAYGNYCIIAKASCPDTTLTNCFSSTPPIPSVGASAKISNKTCSTFTAKVKNQKYLTDPEYCIVDAADDTLSCNATGVFTDILYGDYTIVIKNSCYDTTIVVPVSATPDPFSFTASAARSCNYGFSRFHLTFSGNYPVNVRIFYPGDSLIFETNTSSALWVEDMPDLRDNLFYTIIATDKCGNTDTATLAPVAGYLNHRVSVNQKCPGSVWENGSGDINAVATSNTGSLTVRIIKKGGMIFSPYLIPDIAQDSVSIFQDLGPATYIVRFNTNDGCNQYFYDTVVVNPYAYPNVDRSSAYQCDVNGFSVGAVASDGVGPFTYQIIGSTPAMPSIITSPQSSPIFTIDNGNDYTLIRLRALDACGNATLGDASVLPLANTGISINADCFGDSTTLSVDKVYNSTYSWFLKANKQSEDSVLVGTGFSYTIPELLPRDTGYYVCHLIVNNGCIERVYEFHMNGDCYFVVPVVSVHLEGNITKEGSRLQWKVNHDQKLRSMIVERKQGEGFVEIGRVDIHDFKAPGIYSFLDRYPGELNYYRIRMEMQGGAVVYSNLVHLAKEMMNQIYVYPNPATDFVKIVFRKTDNHLYKIEISNMVHQRMASLTHKNSPGNDLIIRRNAVYSDGMYIIKITDMQTGRSYVQKVIFQSK